jgi:hypothetical protein
MIGFGRLVVFTVVAVAALHAVAIAAAQSPFEGTWRISLSQTRFSPEPIVAFLSEGWYHCTSCNPQIDVRANGADQPVLGQSYETISVREVDARTIQLIAKKGGKVVTEQTRAVSADGNTLSIKEIEHPVGDVPAITTQIAAVRVGLAPARINATSGRWRIARITQSDKRLLITYKLKGDQLTIVQPTGEMVVARLDGRDYPVQGSNDYNAVALRRIDGNTMQEIKKRDGTVVSMITMIVSADGRKMSIADTNPSTDRTVTYSAIKQ